MSDTPPQETYISTYLWQDLRRWQAISRGMPIGPSRTTKELAMSDAHRMGKMPMYVFDGDSHKWNAVAETTS